MKEEEEVTVPHKVSSSLVRVKGFSNMTLHVYAQNGRRRHFQGQLKYNFYNLYKHYLEIGGGIKNSFFVSGFPSVED